MLVVILLIFGGMEKAFIAETTYYDDYRYELGGAVYASSAQTIIDVDAFVKAYASVGDWVGYHFLENPLDASPLWYWIVCILMYITKSYVSVRIFNIIVSSIAVVYVYKFSELVYDERTAKRASNLAAFLPYPVVFSCFGYKDCLIMLITFYLLYCAVKYRNTHILKPKEIVKIVVGLVCLLFTRGGLSALLMLICIIIAFEDVIKGRLNAKTLIIGAAIVVVGAAVFLRSYSTLIYKLQYYLNRHVETLGGTAISFITINKVTDLYKLPFTYIFSIIMPIRLFGKIDSWYAVIANINLLMTPVAVGATAYIFTKKKDNLVYWSCMAYYVISIITSINIFRHYYSIIPFTYIAYANYLKGNNSRRRIIVSVGAVVFSTLLIIYYIQR